jgi:hypothetical protein
MAIGLSGNLVPVEAAVSSSPIFELDASSASSLARTGATAWRDLVSAGSITGSLVGSAAYSATGGGSLSVTAAGQGGAVFPATAAGTVTNPSGDMTLMMWVKFSSFSAVWNLLASRWFTGSNGAENQDWHFALRTSGSQRLLNMQTPVGKSSWGATPIELDTWYLVGFTSTWAGTLQFYVNGVADGPAVTGVNRNANTSAQLWVSDARNTRSDVAMTGNIARFRMWNSAISSTTISNDFNAERENFGYAPVVTSASFTLASRTPVYRSVNTITATVPLDSRVTFYENSKKIPGCSRVLAVSTTALCSWRPLTRGLINVRLSYTIGASPTVNWAPTTTVFGARRTGPR